MLNSIEIDTEKLYYTISEVSELVGLSQSNIRYWEKEFTQLAPKKNKKGNRAYTKKEIETIAKINDLVNTQGYTLAGAKEALKPSKSKITKVSSLSNDASKVSKTQELENLKSFLEKLRDAL